jgi:hypothetical protein
MAAPGQFQIIQADGLSVTPSSSAIARRVQLSLPIGSGDIRCGLQHGVTGDRR